VIAFNSTTKRPFFASLAVQMILPEAACAAVAGCGAAGAGGESGAVPSTDVRPAGGAAGRFSIVGGRCSVCRWTPVAGLCSAPEKESRAARI
jgi:hypothetical protein